MTAVYGRLPAPLRRREVIATYTPCVLDESVADLMLAPLIPRTIGLSPLPHMPQVVTLPHIGSATRRTRFAMAEHLVSVLTGKEALTPIPDLAEPV